MDALGIGCVDGKGKEGRDRGRGGGRVRDDTCLACLLIERLCGN